jgi:tRNA(Ile)-lysidine synthase
LEHGPSLVTLARRALGDGGEAALERGAAVLVAVSGGPDSIALLDVMARIAPALGLRVVAHGVDHGLRPEAARELDVAAEVAGARGVPFGRTDVGLAPGGNLHARARVARYRALASAARAEGASVVATAHHADDRAETVLLRLLRGAGATGLAALPARAKLDPELGGTETTLELVRPLLRARRADVLAHLARHHLPFAEDPSNRDPRFLRARVRAELLPLMAELDPGIVTHLEALADELASARARRESLEAGSDLGREAADAPIGRALPRATQRALAALIRGEGSPRAELWLPNGLVVRRAQGGGEGEGGALSSSPPRRPRTRRAR